MAGNQPPSRIFPALSGSVQGFSSCAFQNELPWLSPPSSPSLAATSGLGPAWYCGSLENSHSWAAATFLLMPPLWKGHCSLRRWPGYPAAGRSGHSGILGLLLTSHRSVFPRRLPHRQPTRCLWSLLVPQGLTGNELSLNGSPVAVISGPGCRFSHQSNHTFLFLCVDFHKYLCRLDPRFALYMGTSLNINVSNDSPIKD